MRNYRERIDFPWIFGSLGIEVKNGNQTIKQGRNYEKRENFLFCLVGKRDFLCPQKG